MFFTDKGRCYWLKVFEIPEASRQARGKSIANLVEKQQDENIAAFVPVQEFDENHYVAMVTENGLIKKTALSEYSNVRRTGITAITLQKGDTVNDVKLTDGTQDIVIGTHNGMAIRFHEKEARPMGRTAAGVRAINLNKGDKVVGAVSIKRRTTSILVVAEHGYGKRSELDEYRVSHRSGKGVFTVRVTDKTGQMVAIKEVLDNDDVVVVTTQGVVIRQPAKEIRLAGRNTQGVRLIRLESGDQVSAVAAVPSEEDDMAAKAEEAAKKQDEEQALLFEPEEKKETKAKGKTATKPSKKKKK